MTTFKDIAVASACGRKGGAAPRRLKPLAERFRKKVSPPNETGCMLWLGAKLAKGYGVLGRGGPKAGNILAHRAAYELAYGPIPEGEGYHGTCVLHRCDNPSCVNPEHLFLGTNRENVDDMLAKGRIQRGEAHYLAKLTEDEVRRIRELGASGMSQREIGRLVGVGQGRISAILRGAAWKHVA